MLTKFFADDNQNYIIMKRIIKVLFAAFVLTLVPATYANAQWKDRGDFFEGLASVYDDNGNEYKIGKTGEIVGRSVDPNSMSWPSPSYDSGWELKNERLFSNKKCWNRGLKWNGGKVVQIIKEIDEHSGRVKHYWVVESGKVYKNENDAEGAAYFYSVYGLKRTRGEGSNFN